MSYICYLIPRKMAIQYSASLNPESKEGTIKLIFQEVYKNKQKLIDFIKKNQLSYMEYGDDIEIKHKSMPLIRYRYKAISSDKKQERD